MRTGAEIENKAIEPEKQGQFTKVSVIIGKHRYEDEPEPAPGLKASVIKLSSGPVLFLRIRQRSAGRPVLLSEWASRSDSTSVSLGFALMFEM